jgi:hypothetical protein
MVAGINQVGRWSCLAPEESTADFGVPLKSGKRPARCTFSMRSPQSSVARRTRFRRAFDSLLLEALIVGAHVGEIRANAAAHLNIRRPGLTYDEMVAANADEYAGEASYKKVIDDAIAEGTRLQPVTADAACFVAGTLVHTKEGLVPIEQIRVGDWVLSQPEQKGERAYKRVVKTFEFEDREVIAVDYLKDGKPGGGFVVAGNHPFWVQNAGWTRADYLQGGEILELADGSACKVFNQSPLERTTEKGVAWMEGMIHSTRGDGFGRTVDMRQGTPRFSYESVPNDVTESEYGLYRTKVYNIEVEDYHTYYVGEIGAWVHNTNCGDVGVQLSMPR